MSPTCPTQDAVFPVVSLPLIDADCHLILMWLLDISRNSPSLISNGIHSTTWQVFDRHHNPLTMVVFKNTNVEDPLRITQQAALNEYKYVKLLNEKEDPNIPRLIYAYFVPVGRMRAPYETEEEIDNHNDEQLHFVMLLSNCGVSLRTMILNNTVQHTNNIIRQMIRIIQRLHASNICHMNIRPENFHVLNGFVYLRGFCNAKQEGGSYSMEEMLPGRRPYVAPEVNNGSQPNKEMDIYPLAVVILDIFSGTCESYVDDVSLDQIVIKDHRKLLLKWCLSSNPRSRPTATTLEINF